MNELILKIKKLHGDMASLFPGETAGAPAQAAEQIPESWKVQFSGYGEFLAIADGWSMIYDDLTLFSVSDTLDRSGEGERIYKKNKKLFSKLRVGVDEVLYIGSGDTCKDAIFALPEKTGYAVLWLSDQGGEKFETFPEFLESLSEYLYYDLSCMRDEI